MLKHCRPDNLARGHLSLLHRDANYTDRYLIYWIVCGTDWVLPAVYQVLLQNYVKCWTMDADGFSIVDNRAGITFGVELYVPWDAPEMAVDLKSVGTVPLRNVPDVFGMIGRRDSVTESRMLQRRDARSIRVLVPDCRGLDQNFHDVTVVDMGDLPESHVSIPELSGGGPVHQNGDAFPAMDGYTPGVYGIADVATLRDLQCFRRVLDRDPRTPVVVQCLHVLL